MPKKKPENATDEELEARKRDLDAQVQDARAEMLAITEEQDRRLAARRADVADAVNAGVVFHDSDERRAYLDVAGIDTTEAVGL